LRFVAHVADSAPKAEQGGAPEQHKGALGA